MRCIDFCITGHNEIIRPVICTQGQHILGERFLEVVDRAPVACAELCIQPSTFVGFGSNFSLFVEVSNLVQFYSVRVGLLVEARQE